MDHTDRLRGLRHPARLRARRLDRRGGALLTRLLLALAAVAAVLLPGAPAWAHNALAEASPDKNATLKKAPSEVRLRFLQKLNPDYTTITVSDADKRAVPVSAPDVDGTTGTVTFTSPPAGGVYTVAYQVVSTDGHTVKGSYQFTVAGAPSSPVASPSVPAEVPSPAPSVPAEAPSVVPAPVASSSSSTGTVVGVVVGIVVVLAGLAGFLFARRRKA